MELIMSTLKAFLFICLLFPAMTVGDDAAALLLFRRNSISSDVNNNLQTWSDSSNSLPACLWAGVSCSAAGEVSSINLHGFGLAGRLHLDDLIAISTLKEVTLSGNSFYGNLSHRIGPGCPFVSVDLSDNKFTDSIPSDFLTGCAGLLKLSLAGNGIPGGMYPLSPSLQEIDFSRNNITDVGLLEYLSSNGRSLRTMNLSVNMLAGELASMSGCPSLASLDLSYNEFSGKVPVDFLSTLPPSLVDLSLAGNNFTGDFSNADFGTCGKLSSLSFGSNNLHGLGLPSGLSSCIELQSLNFSNNLFSGSIPPFLGTMKSLKRIILSNNKYSGVIPPELGSLCPSLVELDLSGNFLEGGLPVTFKSCASLQYLNLGNNNLTGKLGESVAITIPSLKELRLPFNYITGDLSFFGKSNWSAIEVIDLSSNNITGNIPSDLCSSLPSIRRFHFPNNYLTGNLPKSFQKCSNLVAIDFSFNSLEGAIPADLFALPKIARVQMWANELSGELPNNLCSTSPALETLILNNNNISGIIPPSITKCTRLMWISLGNNHLTGPIPASIGNMSKLSVLQLARNSLSGSLPPGLGTCISLTWIDLYSNNITGSIPPELSDSAGLIRQVPELYSTDFAFVSNDGGLACPAAGAIFEYDGIRPERLMELLESLKCPPMRIFKGKMGSDVKPNGTLIYADISHNSLSGPIPDAFGYLVKMVVLNLGFNQLTGPIPRTFGDMLGLNKLYLPHNNLSGSIPGELGHLTSLADLDLSYNNLSGTIPTGGQLITFPVSRYEGNPFLCGVPLPTCKADGSSQVANSNPNNGAGKKRLLGVSVVIGIAISAFIILVLTFILFKVKIKQKEEETRAGYIDSLPTSGTSTWKLGGVMEPLSVNVSTFEKPLRKLTFAHLLEATNGFSSDSMIGSGGFGEVYKAKLKDGNIVAIKKLAHVTGQGEREFTAEMETIGKIKHRNLVPLLGYCKVGDERLLVYEYMKHGSLDNVLETRKDRGALKLPWDVRKNIAIGAARGLAFLHHKCIPHIIHRDMKSSNVLIDDGLVARVSDFGMARLMNAVDTHLSVSSLAGTPGYVPPEYYQSFRCTTKGDVFSFGVVLMELISGKKPIDTEEFGDNNLVGWTKQLVKEGRSSEVIDAEIKEKTSPESDVYKYLKIACDCLEDRPLRRPSMIQVLNVFKQIEGNSPDFEILEDLSIEGTIIDEAREKIP